MILKLHFKKIKQTCIPQKKILQHKNNCDERVDKSNHASIKTQKHF